MQQLQDVQIAPDAIVEHDQHVRAYYDQPANDFEAFASSKYEGESIALAVAHERSLHGMAYDEFGSVQEGGFYARVLFDHAPFIVCLKEDEQGFVSEITNEAFEVARAEFDEQVD